MDNDGNVREPQMAMPWTRNSGGFGETGHEKSVPVNKTDYLKGDGMHSQFVETQKRDRNVLRKELFNSNAINDPRFIRLAEKRTEKVTESLRILGNLANRANYSYSHQQAVEIIGQIKMEFDKLQKKFL